MSPLFLPNAETGIMANVSPPSFDRILAVGERALIALVGPPAIGRAHLIRAASEHYPDMTPLDPEQLSDGQTRQLHVIGVVTDSVQWYKRFTERYGYGDQERAERRAQAITILSWMREQDPTTFHVIDNRNKHETQVVEHLHSYVCEDKALPPPDSRLLGNLLTAAESMGI